MRDFRSECGLAAFAACLGLLVPLAVADEVKSTDPAMQEPGIYIVQPGDTCLDVAKKAWPGETNGIDKLHEYNQMGPLPHNLVPGTRLHIISNVPDATVTFVKPDVHIRKGGKPTWLSGNVGEGLFHLDQLTTLAGASAEVLFRDKSSLQLDQNALITIYDSALGSKKLQRSGAIELLQGDLRLSLSSLRGEKGGMEVRTPGAQVAASGANFTVGVDAKKMSRVSVFDGNASVVAQGASVDVRHGYGTRVTEGTAPETPQLLPAAPVWSLGGAHDVLLALRRVAPISLKWAQVTTAVRYQIELATDDKFNTRIIVRSVESSEPLTVDLPQIGLGRYFARASAFNASGLVGPPSVIKIVDVAGLTLEAGVPGKQAGSIVGAVQIRVRLPQGANVSASVDGVPVTGNPVVIDGLGTHKLRIVVGDGQITTLDAIVQKPQCRVEFAKDLKHATIRFYDLQGQPAWFPVARELGVRGRNRIFNLRPDDATHTWVADVIPFQNGATNFGADIEVQWSNQTVCEAHQ